MRRRSVSHVLGVADTPDLAELDRAHELDLEQRRDLGDLVQEQRAALGGGEEPDLVGDGAREGALDVPEQLGLHEPFGDRPAVHGDERLVAAVAIEVDGARHQLLAGAALARDHGGGGAVRDLADGVEDLDDLRALADDVLEAVLGLELLSEVQVLVAQPLALEPVLDDQVDLVELEGLGDVVVGAELHRLHRRLGGGDGGDDDHGRVGRQVPGGPEHLHAVHLWHAQVGDDGVEGVPPDRLDGGLPAVGGRHVVARSLERDGEELPHALLVVYDQHSRCAHGRLMLGDRAPAAPPRWRRAR